MSASERDSVTSKSSHLDGGPGAPPEEDVWEWLQHGITLSDSATAIISLHQPATHLSHLTDTAAPNNRPYLTWTYKQLKTASYVVATHLSQHGIGPDDVVATLVPNGIEFAIFFWASLILGATFVPMYPPAIQDRDHFKHLLRLTSPTVIVVDDMAQATNLNLLLSFDEAAKIKLRLVCKPQGPGGSPKSTLSALFQSLEDIRPPQLGSVFDTRRRTHGSKPATIMFTSGTTGAPKGCAISHASFCAQCDGYRAYAANPEARWSPSMRFIITSANYKPLFWLATFSTWRSGGTVILPGADFDPTDTLRAMADKDLAPTHAFLVPRLVRILASHPDLVSGKCVPMNMKFVNVTGDCVDRGLLELCQKNLRVQSVISVFGMTEGAGISNWNREGEKLTFTSKNQGELVGVGRALPGARIKVCSPGLEEPVKRGEMGDLHVSAVNFISTYLENEDEYNFYVNKDGRKWVITGDKALVDDNDVLYIMGRTKDMIQRKDKEIAPAILQSVLHRRDSIVDAQVVGVPHKSSGEVPLAVVKLKEDASLPNVNELNKEIEKQLGQEYRLSDAVDLNRLGREDWPYNDMGKVIKKDIAKAAAEHMNS